MADLSSDLHLLPGEELVGAVSIPFHAQGPRLGLDLVIDVLTDTRQKMPVAFVDLDGDGTLDGESARDALISIAFVGDMQPNLAEISLRRLAANPNLAAEGVDVVPLFIVALSRAIKRNPSLLIESLLAKALVRSIEWLGLKLKVSPIGLIESDMSTEGTWGAWTDTVDAFHHFDGTLARGLVAPLEAQAFAYDALMEASDLARAHLIPGDSNQLWMRAQRLRRTIIEQMWITSADFGGYFANGVERYDDLTRPLGVRTANMGLLLNSRLLEGMAYQRYVDAIVEQLFNVDGLMSEAGIRTLSAGEVRFRPDGTHTGAVWIWQNLWIAAGLRRHNRSALAGDLEMKMALIGDVTQCVPQFVEGGAAFRPRMVELLVDIRSEDGHNSFVEHLAIQPARTFSAAAAFGLYSLELRESFERSLDVIAI